MPTKKEVEELFNKLRELEQTIADLKKEKQAATKSAKKKAKEFPRTPVVYVFGKGIECICPICHRSVVMGVCPKTEKKVKKGIVPTEVLLDCGDKLPVIFSR